MHSQSLYLEIKPNFIKRSPPGMVGWPLKKQSKRHFMPYHAMLCFFYAMFYHFVPFYTMLSHSMLCHVIPFYASLCHVIPFYAIFCRLMPCYAILCHLMQCSSILGHLCHLRPCYTMLCHFMSFLPGYAMLSHFMPVPAIHRRIWFWHLFWSAILFLIYSNSALKSPSCPFSSNNFPFKQFQLCPCLQKFL